MKKITALFLIAAIALLGAVTAGAKTDPKTSDGVYTYEVVKEKYIRLKKCVAPEKAQLNEDGSYTIPSEADGKPVKYLGKNLFSDSDVPARRVIVPDTVTHIEDGAFWFDYPSDSMTGRKAANMSALEEIELPEGLVSIGANAFRECRFFDIKLPESLITIGEGAFRASFLETVEIPGDVESIGKSAFQDCGELESVVINSPLKTIEEHTFYFCENLSKIKLPDTITKIGYDAFYFTALKSFSFNEDVDINFSAFMYDASVKLGYVKGSSHKVLYDLSRSHYKVVYYEIPNKNLGHIFKAGNEIKLKVKGKTATDWKSDNEKAVKMTKDGKAVMRCSGVANVSARLSDGKTFKCRIRTTGYPSVHCPSQSGKNASYDYITVKRGESVKLEIRERAKSEKNVFKSTSYAKILGDKYADRFYVNGLKKGKTTLKAIINGKTIKVKVKVV